MHRRRLLEAVGKLSFSVWKNWRKKRENGNLNWTKRRILFELPCWDKLLLRHNIDVMHVEKSLCDNLLVTYQTSQGKIKDTDKARLVLEYMNIRWELYLVESNGRCSKPPADMC